VRAIHAQLEGTVARQQEPITLLAATMTKIAGATLVGAAVAVTVTIARRRHRNDVVGAA
jgi:hypothetical protein